MALNSDSLNFDYIPAERREILFPQSTSEMAPPPTLTDPFYLYELLLMETPILPQPVIFLPPKWHKIPQQPYNQRQWDFRPAQDILFPVHGQPGVNMGDALRKRFTTLEGRDDLVLQGARTAFSCRIWYPGYPLNKSPQIFTTFWNRDRDPISRSQLAFLIARKLEKYLDSMSSSHIMDPSTDEQWRIGEGYMTLGNMFLAKLESVSNGSYQPEIWVMDPTM